MTLHRTEVITVHGWGFSGTIWDPWKAIFPPSTTFRSFDRGYFGQPRAVQWHTENRAARRVLLLHSMAPLLCPTDLIQRADLILFFGGFLHFHPRESDRSTQRSRDILQRMKQELEQDPGKVLENFYRRGGLPFWGDAIGEDARGIPGREGAMPQETSAIGRSDTAFNPRLLSEDLDRLDSEEIDWKALRTAPKVLIFHGSKDRIVPLEHGEALAKKIGDHASFYLIPGAGHALPFTHIHEIRRTLVPLLILR